MVRGTIGLALNVSRASIAVSNANVFHINCYAERMNTNSSICADTTENSVSDKSNDLRHTSDIWSSLQSTRHNAEYCLQSITELDRVTTGCWATALVTTQRSCPVGGLLSHSSLLYSARSIMPRMFIICTAYAANNSVWPRCRGPPDSGMLYGGEQAVTSADDSQSMIRRAQRLYYIIAYGPMRWAGT